MNKINTQFLYFKIIYILNYLFLLFIFDKNRSLKTLIQLIILKLQQNF